VYRPLGMAGARRNFHPLHDASRRRMGLLRVRLYGNRAREPSRFAGPPHALVSIRSDHGGTAAPGNTRRVVTPRLLSGCAQPLSFIRRGLSRGKTVVSLSRSPPFPPLACRRLCIAPFSRESDQQEAPAHHPAARHARAVDEKPLRPVAPTTRRDRWSFGNRGHARLFPRGYRGPVPAGSRRSRSV